MKLPIAEYTIQLTYLCPYCNQTATIEIDKWDFEYWSTINEDTWDWESQLNLEVKDCIHCGNSFEDIRLI